MAFAMPARPSTPSDTQSAGFTRVRELGGIVEYRLDANGLDVLLLQDFSAPVVTFNVTYRVGSRNEVTGTTGATHLLEHLMFKGSEHFNAPAHNSLKDYVEGVGGSYNATTWLDRTSYFASIGRERLEGYIAIEADRMRNLWLHESDRQAEMTVVRNEFERGKNDPHSVLAEEVRAVAYQALPYHHSTIGWRSDIEHVPIEKLRAFYDTYYWPNNATISVVGDFDAARVLEWIRKDYGGYSASPAPIPPMYTEEPPQTGPRRLIVKQTGELGAILIAHKVPDGRNPDQASLAVMDAILSDGKNSRLYRALVDRGLALDADADTSASHDLALHTISIDLAPQAKHETAERAALEVVAKLQRDGPTAEEVQRVKQQVRAAEAYKRDGTAAISAELTEWIAAGDWTLYVRFPQEIQKVTAADVQRVAKAYLNEDQSTTGWFVPTGTR